MNFGKVKMLADKDQFSDELFESVARKPEWVKEFVHRYKGWIKWEDILQHYKVPEILLEEFADEFNTVHWNWISGSQKLSENFIRKHQDEVHWVLISEMQTLSEDFIAEFRDKVSWPAVSYNQKLSEKFIC